MAESEFTPTAAEIKEEESGADDPALVKLDKAVPELDDEDDDDLSNEEDGIDEDDLIAERYDPANDGNDSVLAELHKEIMEKADG